MCIVTNSLKIFQNKRKLIFQRGYGCEIDFLIGVFYIPNNILFL